MVIPQNGDKLIFDPRLLRAIDGMSREDLLYGETALGERNALNNIAESVARLNMVAGAGKPVLVVEYPRGRELAGEIMDEIQKFGFIGYVTSRELNDLSLPPLGPDDHKSPWSPDGGQPVPYLPAGAATIPLAPYPPAGAGSPPDHPAGTTGHTR
jgi:hypothetical protein